MFGVGFTELLLLAAIALVVLGPEKLPHAARMAGAWYGRIRRTLAHMQHEIEQEVNALEVRQKMQSEMAKMKQAKQDFHAHLSEISQQAAAISPPVAGIVDIHKGSTQVPKPPGGGRYYFLLGTPIKAHQYYPKIPFIRDPMPCKTE